MANVGAQKMQKSKCCQGHVQVMGKTRRYYVCDICGCPCDVLPYKKVGDLVGAVGGMSNEVANDT